MSSDSTPNTPTPESVYQTLWKSRVERGGIVEQLKLDRVRIKLTATLNNLAFLYNWMTNGKVTSPLANMEKAMKLSDKLMGETMDELVKSKLQTVLDEITWAESVDKLDDKAKLAHISSVLTTMLDGDLGG